MVRLAVSYIKPTLIENTFTTDINIVSACKNAVPLVASDSTNNRRGRDIAGLAGVVADERDVWFLRRNKFFMHATSA